MDPKRLKKILEITRRVERARKGELSNARHEELLALQQLEQARRDEREQLRLLAEAGDLGVNALFDRARGLTLAAEHVHRAREQHAASNVEVSAREKAAHEAMQDVRKFEILCERDREERMRAAKNAEQQTLDETRRSPRRGA